MALYWYRAQNAAGIRIAERKWFLESIFRTPLRRPGASVSANLDAQVPGSGRQGLQQSGHADDRHHALHVVGEHIECHLG